MMHICVIKPAIIGSDSGLSPSRRQAIIWTNDGILLIGSLGKNLSEILIKIYTFPFKKLHLKMWTQARFVNSWLQLCPIQSTAWSKASAVVELICFSWNSWWRHQMETFSALLAICAGNSPVPGEFPTQRPVMRSFDVFFDLRLNKRLSKQSWGWWLETLSRPLWRHRYVFVTFNV